MRPIIAAFALALLASPAHAQWPLEPTGSDHPIGNTFGEYQAFGIDFFHAGIDILATPQLNADGTVNAAAPWVRATVAGTPVQMGNSPGSYNFAYVETAAGRQYLYGHLQQNSYDADFTLAFNNGTAIAAGDEVSKVARWGVCDYHHHHYEIWDAAAPTTLIGPYPAVAPDPDGEFPLIDDVTFGQDNSNPWTVLGPVAPGACSVVTNQVDIVAKVRDRNSAGSAHGGATTNWVRNLRWRACPDSAPGCAWLDTHVYDNMPYAWWGGTGTAAARAAYSTRAPWVSDSDYCAAAWFYGIVTNFAGGLADAAGRWDTTALANGSYSVNVEATDFAGNVTTASRRACVQNGGGCTTELMLRDAGDDLGGIPYPGPNWWLSPDITANPGTAFEDANIRVGAANPIDVRVTNSGSCALAAGATYDVCLGWGPPSGSIAHPLPAAQVIQCQTVTVPAGGWAVGAPRTTTFSWTPDAASVPLGHHCLVAWVNHASDPVLNTPSVRVDDNRAQQNIEFVMPPGLPGAPQTGAFWVNPQRIEKRSLEIRLSAGGQSAAELRLYIPPGLKVGRVRGGELAATTPTEKPTYPNAKLEACQLPCPNPEEAERRGCARVIRGIDPNGRIVLEGISVSSPQQLLLELRGDAAVSADVVESGLLPEARAVEPFGGLTIRFEKR